MTTMNLMNDLEEDEDEKYEEPVYFNMYSKEQDILPSESKYMKISTKNQEPINLSSPASANSTLQEGKHSVLRRDSIDEQERLELEKKVLDNNLIKINQAKDELDRKLRRNKKKKKELDNV